MVQRDFEEKMGNDVSVEINGILFDFVEQWERRILANDHLENIEYVPDEALGIMEICFNSDGEYFISVEDEKGYHFMDFGNGDHEQVYFEQNPFVEKRYLNTDINLCLSILKEYIMTEEMSSDYHWEFHEYEEDERILGKCDVLINGTEYGDMEKIKTRLLQDSHIEDIGVYELSYFLEIKKIMEKGFMIEYSDDSDPKSTMKRYFYDNGTGDDTLYSCIDENKVAAHHICSDMHQIIEILEYFLENKKMHPSYQWTKDFDFEYAGNEDEYDNSYETGKSVENHMEIPVDHKGQTIKVICGAVMTIIVIIAALYMSTH